MKKKMIWKSLLFVLSFTAAVCAGSPAQAEWQFGIGTGLMLMNADGDMGFNVNAVNQPVKFDISLSPADFQDFTQSAFGFGGFATDGKWMIQYSYGSIDLQDGTSTVLPGGMTTVHADVDFTMTGAEIIVGYPVYRTDSFDLRVHTGARYTKHELSMNVSSTGAINDSRGREIDNDWTDVLIGVLADVRLAEKWTWNNRLDAGFGGSEGTYFAYTGVGWRFHKHWSATLYGQYMAVDFENDSPGDPDWYLYDVDESGVGLNVLFIW